MLNNLKIIKLTFEKSFDSTIDKLDGVRYLWSLMKSDDNDILSSVAEALCLCIRHVEVSGAVWVLYGCCKGGVVWVVL